MKKTLTCPCCGHQREVEACEKCAGSGLELSLPQAVAQKSQAICLSPPRTASISPCPDCQGTGIKGAIVVVRN